MLQKLRERMASEKGFTLIELLVVMLIIGILAAIAIPTFFNQKQKAQDADTKAMAHTVQTAIETYATDNGGAYTGATPANLNAIENTVDTAHTAVPTATGDRLRRSPSRTRPRPTRSRSPGPAARSPTHARRWLAAVVVRLAVTGVSTQLS